MSDRSRLEGLVEIHTSRPADRSLIAPERDVLTGRKVDFDRSDKGRDQPSTQHFRPQLSPAHSGAVTLAARGRGWRTAAGVTAVVASLLVVGVVTAGAVSLGWFRGGATDSGPTAAGGAPVAASTTGTAPTSAAGTPGVATTPGAVTPALDPKRINGYRVTATRSLIKVGPGRTISASERVGSTYTQFWDCLAGTCKARNIQPYNWTFPAATAALSFTTTRKEFGPDYPWPCDPIRYILKLTRAADGSYSGTYSRVPNKVYWKGASRECYTPQTADTLRLEPIVK